MLSKDIDVESMGAASANQDATQDSDSSLKDSDSELFILKRKDLRVLVSNQTDVLAGRYKIQGSEPLKDFTTSFADAFRVLDQKDKNNIDIYGLVLDRRYPIRLKEINALLEKKQEGLCNILAASLVNLSFKSGSSYVVIVEKPKGISLAQHIQQHGATSEEFIVQKIISPVNDVLSFLHKNKVMHGRINLNNIYIDEAQKIHVVECISSICGFHQHVLYEPLPRAPCLPEAKGAGDYKADYYALGVIANLMLLSGNPYAKLSEKDVLQLKFTQSTYAMLSKNLQLSPHMLDMLRGTINDHSSELWNHIEMTDWCKGRRFNLLPQSSRTDATRSIEFNGYNYINRKHLANDLALNWTEAKAFVVQERLNKWIERSVQDSDLAEQLLSLQGRAGKQVYTEGFDSIDLLVAETILLLDPNGPLRIKNLVTSIDGLGSLLAYAYANNKNEMKHFVRCILEFGIIFDWSNISPKLSDGRYQQTLFTLQRCSDMISKRGYGFELERCLYEMNTSLSCQSSQVFDATILTIDRLLQFLNDAPKLDGDLIDKHIAAFVANRVELPSAIRVKSLKNFPDLANHIHIQSLALYALAQQRSGMSKLPGLAEKLQQRLEEIIELFHSAKIRDEIYSQLKDPVKKGMLVQILKVLTNVNYVFKDRHGFRKAKKDYYLKTQHILSLNNKRAIANMGYRYGLQLAVMLSFLVATITTLTLIIKVF